MPKQSRCRQRRIDRLWTARVDHPHGHRRSGRVWRISRITVPPPTVTSVTVSAGRASILLNEVVARTGVYLRDRLA
jgi:hypothetical protein